MLCRQFNLKVLKCLILVAFIGLSSSLIQAQDRYKSRVGSASEKVYSTNARNLKKVKGNSIQIDPSVLYSCNISPDSLIRDLKKAKITSVHLLVVNSWDGQKDDNLFRPAYLDALKRNDIAIWLMLPGNCMYDQLPKEWEMEFITPFAEQNLRFYSFHQEAYIQWQERRIERIFKNYDFEGIGFAESYFPEWNTIHTNGHYGDISLFARTKFTRDFLNSPDEILTFDAIYNNPELFSKWQDFRVDAILEFNRRVKDVVRRVSPTTVFASWVIAVLGGSVSEIRQHYGLDLARIAKEVKPDVMFVQTSYQEWGNPTLPIDYIKGYKYAKEAIEQANPQVKVGVQADITSLSYHNPGIGVRVPAWWLKFMEYSKELGYYTNTSYEYAFSKKQGLWPN